MTNLRRPVCYDFAEPTNVFMRADLIISNIGQLITCASPGGPKRGAAMADAGVVDNAAVAVGDGKILALGTVDEINRGYSAENVIDAGGCAVSPGFVDPHTHVVYAGDRLAEFELKIRGAEYLEILAAGGGILSTVEHTRAATLDDLVGQSRKRLDTMLRCGTTTCEIKTGYGLETDAELKMLDAISELERTHAMTIVPTYLAAHTVPPEFRDSPARYVNLICESMLPQAWRWFTASPFHGKTPFFCDVFCEKGAFSLAETQRILETARSLGFKLKGHVDQFSNIGGTAALIEMGATSVDHLDATSEDEIAHLAASRTIGVVTPTVNFNHGSTNFADARSFLDRGCALALSTDINPGSAPCPSQQMSMAIASRYQKLMPAEALNAATINAAHAVGLGAKVGSIEPGKDADLLILDTTDHRDLAYQFGGNLVAAVIKSGKRLSLC